MTINSSFIYREILTERLLVPIGNSREMLNGIVRLSETGAFLWQLLSTNQTIESLAQALTEEYDVDLPRATDACEKFIAQLREIGCLEE